MRTFLSVLIVLLLAATAMGTDNAITLTGKNVVTNILTNVTMGTDFIEAEGVVIETVVVLDNGTAARDSQFVELAEVKLSGWKELFFWAYVDSIEGAMGLFDPGDATPYAKTTYCMDSLWTVASKEDTLRLVLQNTFNGYDYTDIQKIAQDTVIGNHQTVAQWYIPNPIDSVNALRYLPGDTYRIGVMHDINIGDLGDDSTADTMFVRYRFGYKGFR